MQLREHLPQEPERGQVAKIDGKPCIYFDGYWIRYYEPPEDNLANKKQLIETLTRRTFHHTESGINTPGDKLKAARKAYRMQTDPVKKRVNGAMLAGALFNRAADIFTMIVELAEKGVQISEQNELMRQCGECFEEALELGTLVKHYSGEEGIDELWGEPFKAFTMPIEKFYESRYIKVAQTMRDIDRVADHMKRIGAPGEFFKGIESQIDELAAAAKMEAEIMRKDQEIFTVWPRFVAACEALENLSPQTAPLTNDDLKQRASDRKLLIRQGTQIIRYLAGARVPMPKTTREYIDKCDYFLRTGGLPRETFKRISRSLSE